VIGLHVREPNDLGMAGSMHQPGEWHAGGNDTHTFSPGSGSEMVQTATYFYDACQLPTMALRPK
jgi:hypothetical protein